MQTIAIDIEKTKKPREIADILEKESVQPGDTVLVFTKKDELAFHLVSLLVIIWFALHYIAKKKEAAQPHQSSDDADLPGTSSEIIMNDFETPEAAEEAIENKFGINVIFSVKSEQQYDPIEAAFGMWQDRDVTIEKIRAEAWQRTR